MAWLAGKVIKGKEHYRFALGYCSPEETLLPNTKGARDILGPTPGVEASHPMSETMVYCRRLRITAICPTQELLTALKIISIYPGQIVD